MISVLWAVMVIFALICGGISGRLDAVSAGVSAGASTAVRTALTIAGPLCLWCGVGELMDRYRE